MYKSQLLNHVINLIIIISCIISFFILFVNQNAMYEGYELMYLLPLSYIFFHFILTHNTMKRYGVSVFLAVYLVVSLTRYSILPIFVFESGWYFGRSLYMPSSDLFEKAIILMIYELFIYNFTILFSHKFIFSNTIINKKELVFKKSNVIYIIFILFTGFLVLLKPSSLNFISFLNVNPNYMSIEKLDLLSSIVIVFLSLARYILYFLVIKSIIHIFRKKYPVTEFLLVSMITVLNSLIIFGTNRSDFLFTFIISLIILFYLYGKKSIILSSAFVLLIPITISKLSSYRQSATITNGADKMIDITDYLQVYLSGIYNVALSLELESRIGNLYLMFADIFRSAIGPNIFLKNIEMITSSQLFNQRIYLNDHVAQIIPMIGQGNLYLGMLLSPMLGATFIFIAIYLTKIICETRRFEVVFILMLTAGRFGFVMAQNGNILINELTFTLPLFIVIYYLNNKVGYKIEQNH